MLDVKTCQALAKVYPEIREHVFVEGDRFWRYWRPPFVDGDQPEWTLTPCMDDDTRPVTVNPTNPAVADVWCPLLSDLLAIAEARTRFRVSLFRDWDGQWRFTDEHDPYGPPTGGSGGPTPEDAIAEWLLVGIHG